MFEFGEDNGKERLLIEKWDKAEGGMSINDIEDKYMRRNMAQLLENQSTKYGREVLRESRGTTTNTAAQTHQGQQGAFEPISLALVRSFSFLINMFFCLLVKGKAVETSIILIEANP